MPEKCPNCESLQTHLCSNNSGTYKFYYCFKCECKWKYDDGEQKIINPGKEILID
jgi:hypothetical protein